MQHNESARLRAVKVFKQLNFNKDKEFQRIADLAAEICQTPFAMITLLDDKTNWVKVKVGADIPHMPYADSFCQYTISSNGSFEVEDTMQDRRFVNNPLVINNPNVRFYSAFPLLTNDGHSIGTLCVMDTVPKQLSNFQRSALEMLSSQVIYHLEGQQREKLLKEKVEALKKQNEIFKKIAQLQSHEIRGPVATIMGLIGLIKDENYVASKEYLLHLEQAANALDDKIHEIVSHSQLGIDAYLEC